MNLKGPQFLKDADEEIPALIETLLATEQRLAELTAGEVDTVASRDGRTFMLRHAQEQLRYSEAEKQAAILDALPAHIALLDAQGIILSVNKAWHGFAITNVFHAPGHGIGLNYLEVCDRARGDFSAEAHQVAAGVRSVLGGTEKSFSIEYPCHSPAEQRWFLLIVTPLVEGRRSGAVVMHVNITERKQAQTNLSKSEAMLRGIMDSSQDCIKILDREGYLLWMNEGGQKIMEIDDFASVNRKSWVCFWPPVEQAAALAALELGRNNQVGKFTGSCPTAKGSPRWWEVVITPMLNDTGFAEKLLAVSRDITARRKLEEQLRQSQKMDAIGQLAGGVAHDFNNILAAIQLQAALLKMGENLSPEQNELTDDIGEAVQRAAALTQQLLMFSRKGVMREQNLDLNDSIESMLRMLRRTIGEDIQVQLKLAGQPMLLHADPGMMDQVLLNLSVNARDAMPKGGQLMIETSGVKFDELSVAGVALARPGSFVCLSVSDNGSGISPENMARIFEPFFTTKEVGKGTGLGLATVFGIVQQHKGWISVSSEVGQGTTFRIYLPRLAELSGGKSTENTSRTLPGGTETILLVEDEPALRVMVNLSLSRLGYQVLDAANGVEALAVWKEHRDEIHLVLTDLVMPGGMNGIELGARLLKEKPKLKMIYASGYSSEVAGKDFPLKEGVNFLKKPFQRAKLAQTVRAMLDA